MVPPGSVPQREQVPVFGRRRRGRKPSSSQTSEITIPEEVAEKQCREYGFLRKPAYMAKWSVFLTEIRQAELTWSLLPSGGLTLRVASHANGSSEDLRLFNGQNSNRTSSIADLFESLGSIINGSRCEENVFFRNETRVESLRIMPRELPADFPSDPSDVFTMARSTCPSVALDIFHVNVPNGVSTPLFTNFSFLAFCNAFLNSIPIFLRKNDIGIRNVDFVTPEQMQHFRFAWCYLRREGWMSPLDIGEFDCLLPAK